MISFGRFVLFLASRYFFKYMPYFLRTLEPSVPTINYDLWLVLEKVVVLMKQ